MNTMNRTLFLIVFGTFCATSMGGAVPEETKAPPYEVTKTEIKLPGVTISRVTSEVRVKAVACLESGILEYVVCRPDTFEHEAIFTTAAKPELVHAALLLIGLEPTPQKPGLAELWFEEAMKREASRLNIEVEWKEKDDVKRVTLASLLRRRGKVDGAEARKKKKEKVGAVENAWVFAGSFIRQNPETGERFYAANGGGVLVGIWPNPSTVIQFGISEGNPYDGKDLGMEIREDRVPKKGTGVELIFSKLAPPKNQKKSKQDEDTKNDE